MLKMIGYEFRKNRVGLMIMLIIAAGLFALMPAGVLLKKDGLQIISVMALSFYMLAAYIYVLIRGIIAYSGELRSKTGYLLMMVPRSGYSVVFSKLIFTFLFALLLMAVAGFALFIALLMLLRAQDGYVMTLDSIRQMAESFGVPVSGLFAVGLGMAGEVIASVLSFVGAGYLAVTVSAALLSGRKGRGWASFGLLVALCVLSIVLSNLVSPAYNVLDIEFKDILPLLMPPLILHVAYACVCTALSGLLLERKVSL